MQCVLTFFASIALCNIVCTSEVFKASSSDFYHSIIRQSFCRSGHSFFVLYLSECKPTDMVIKTVILRHIMPALYNSKSLSVLQKLCLIQMLVVIKYFDFTLNLLIYKKLINDNLTKY